MKNALAECIAKKLAKMNANIPKRKKKWSRTQELNWCAEQMGVTYTTCRKWYHNIEQPAKFRMYPLAKLYKMKFEKFFTDSK